MLEKSDLQAIQELIQASIKESLQPVNDRLDTMDNRFNEINTRLDTMDSQFNEINTRLDTMQDDITVIKADVKALKNDVRFNRKTEINVMDYIENRLDEKIDNKINQLKAELNKTA